MEKYEAILRTINDKIADCEKTIEYYREVMSQKDATIRMAEARAFQAEQEFSNAKARLETLEKAYENKLDETNDLKAANAKLTAKINEFENF